MFDIALVSDSTGKLIACFGMLLITVEMFLKKRLAHLSVYIYGYDGN